MAAEKEYEISVDARILELLGPNLYTNIYYVLAELIANAYDASAKNVYVISQENKIIVEDDGTGMSYSNGDVKKYLNVAAESRTTGKDSYTELEPKRRKMGRKGVGKLAALSVSKIVHVKTKKNNEKSGFILSRAIPDDKKLTPLSESEINFVKINELSHGTSIVMLDPHYSLHKTPETIKRNLLKIFPLVNNDFKIHIIVGDEEVSVTNFDAEMINQLACLELIGPSFHKLEEYYENPFPTKTEAAKLLEKNPTISIPVKLINKENQEKPYSLEINGWIGSYTSTRGRKLSNETDFPDNFVSLFANNKLGEFNIIPNIGKNKLQEVFVVGQLHVDLFEETELPDMALSNRQGYKTDDLRYIIVKQEAVKLLENAIKLRTIYSNFDKQSVKRKKEDKNREREVKFKENLKKYNKEISEHIIKKIEDLNSDIPINAIEEIVEQGTKKINQALGVKGKIDSEKKKILLSQTSDDKAFADVIYSMLRFNNIPAKDILYSASEDMDSVIPEGTKIYDYLRDFFVDSISDQKIYVVYVTSKNMHNSWGCVLEVGAGWITKQDYKIFNLDDYIPKQPLNDGTAWQQSYNGESKNINLDKDDFERFSNDVAQAYSALNKDDTKEPNLAQLMDKIKDWQDSFNEVDGKIRMNKSNFKIFVRKILAICEALEYTPKTEDANYKQLETLVDII